MVVVEDLNLAEIKTKAFANTLGTLEAAAGSLVVDAKDNNNLVRSIRNMKNHQFLPPEGVNVYDLLRHKHLVVTKEAAKALEARCLRKRGASA